MTRPLLNPPCTGWKQDLPTPYDAPVIEASLGNKTPNHQDDIYLEIPRPALSARGLMSLFTLPCALFTLSIPGMILDAYRENDSVFMVIGPLMILISAWMTLFTLRVDISPPRDEPIRFNRARQKIYAYNFKHRWWNPFEKWEVVPVSYDWSQVRAERWSQVGALNGGVIFKWGVMLSIIEPATNNVIDRFRLSTMCADEYLWAYVCTYMQEGPSALPPPGPPKDHNDVLWCEVALRLAPKVTWPPEMDLESTTAP
ncbi:DUF6708 domain-containing protein [Pseudomonas sp. NPDC089752]|uniref:DUF6708 domain-containing protein n=1 Tax=Pseudomonas sp. NPDC089752 TaxID=3364472 RepID=UPI00381E3635